MSRYNELLAVLHSIPPDGGVHSGKNRVIKWNGHGQSSRVSFEWVLNDDNKINIRGFGKLSEIHTLLSELGGFELKDLYPPKAQKTVIKQFNTVKEWMDTRFIPTHYLEGLPVIIDSYINNEGKRCNFNALKFCYENNIFHQLANVNGKDLQNFTPKGEFAKISSLWWWDNPKLVNPDPKTLYLAEGEKDALMLIQFGFTAVGVPGAQNFNQRHAEWIKETFHEFDKIRIAFDNDEAGRKGTERVIGFLRDMGFVVEYLVWDDSKPNGYDITDLRRDSKNNFEKDFFASVWKEVIDLEEIYKVLRSLKYPMTTVSAASEIFINDYEEVVRYCKEREKWVVWNGSNWEFDDCLPFMYSQETGLKIYKMGEATSNKGLMRWGRKCLDYSGIMAILNAVEQHVKMQIAVDDLDKWQNEINVANGIIDLQKGELIPHVKEHKHSKIVPIKFNKKAKCPTWMGALDRYFNGNKELIDYVQKLFGYCMTGETSEQSFWILHGEGSNGKSTVLEVLRKLTAKYSLASGIETFTVKNWGSSSGHQEDLARLAGARVVVSIENEMKQQLAERLLKSLTGGDRITASRKYEHSFEFTPQFKLLLAVNHRPVIKDSDWGIWRRIKMIPFNQTIGEGEKDRFFWNKLEAEMEGILAWAVEGARKWYKEGLQPPTVVNEATDQFKQKRDSVAAFASELYESSTNSKDTVRSSELFKEYKDYCIENGEKPLSNHEFSEQMLAQGWQKQRYNDGVHYLGIKRKEIEVPKEEVLESSYIPESSYLGEEELIF